MKLQKAPSSIRKTVKFPASVTSYLKSENGQHEHFQGLKGGLLKDTQYAWLSWGPNFVVIRTSNGAKVAAWTFGAVLRDSNTRVTCACELPSNDGSGRVSQFAVGLECEFVGGMVCVFDIRGSKVLRAVHVPSKVVSMSVVDSGTGGCYPLPQILSSMTGIIAVGLAGGDVLLLDLCRVNYDEGVGTLPSSELRDELHACQILPISIQETDQDTLEYKRMNAARTGEHLTVVLNERFLADKTFLLPMPDGNTLTVPRRRVNVTALMYVPRIASVVIGFSFGSFQIWNLMNLTLEYVSPTMQDPLPIVSFGFQEPCDDPRNFCYLWAVHSNGSSQRQRLPFAVMYALCYQTKEWLDGYGYLYQEFVSCVQRFDFDLGSEDSGTTIVGGRCITCNTINKISPVAAKRDGPRADLDESVQESDLTLCLFVWETWGATCPGSSQMALFDLNQWYKEQMPLKVIKGQASTYMTIFSMDEVVEGSFHAANPLLDVRVDPSSISQFTAVQSLEEHYYPSALSFESLSLLGEELVVVNHPGVQRDILAQLEQSGPSALLHPTKLFHHCIAIGLKPVYTEVASTINCPLAEQREFLLSVALEYQLVGFLSRCATEWMDGSQSAMGCTLQGLLKWGWQRANTLKTHSDSLCIPLYDYSGMKLDSNSYQLLDYCGNQLHHLTTLFQGVLKVCKNPNIRGVGDLEHQARVLELVAVYIEVVEWFVNVGLLPEYPCSELALTDSFLAAENFGTLKVPYPAATLTKIYKNRRTELERLSRSAADKTDILFIDGLVKRECNGDRLSSLWERDGGTGLYPPPSIQSLLRTYLLDGIPMHVKHCIVIYVFLDLTGLLESRQYNATINQFIKFPSAFRLTPSFIKITQALWLLDHQDFTEAIDTLLDPLVSMDDLKPWQHQCIIRAFLYQGQHQMALRYIRVQQPPLKDIEDIRLNLTVLLVNGLIHEAFQYQRQHCNEQNSKDLLQHFFSACQQMNQLSVVLQLALSPTEEEAFIQFLQSCQNPRADDMRVMYYLERSRIAEAMEVNDSIRSSRSHIETSSSLKRGRSEEKPSCVRDTIVQAYANTLPSVTRKLALYCAQEKSKFFSWKQVTRPTPMSVAVHRGNLQPVRYRSSLIQATLEKARETWSQVLQSPAPQSTPAKRDRSSMEKSSVEMTPFLCTPRSSSETVGFSRDVTAVVFPILTHPSPKSDDETLGGSPVKRFRYSEHYPSSHRKKLDRYASVDAQSILQTPHVRRRTPSVSRQNDTSTTSIFTPQSILKVRKLVRRSTSPDNVSHVSLPSFTPTSTTPDLAEEDEERMQVSDEDAPTGRQIRFSFPMETPSRESSVTSEVEEVTGPITRSASKRSILGGTPRKALPRAGRLDSPRFITSASEKNINRGVSNVDANLSRVIHDKAVAETRPTLEEETESASAENDSDPFYSLENSITGMTENSESPLKKQRVNSPDRDSIEKMVTEEKLISKVEKNIIEETDDTKIVKETSIDTEVIIKTTETIKHVTNASENTLEGEAIEEEPSSLERKPSEGGILLDETAYQWPSFEENYEDNAEALDSSESVCEVIEDENRLEGLAKETIEVQGRESAVNLIEDEKRVESSVDEPSVEMGQEEGLEKSREGDTTSGTYSAKLDRQPSVESVECVPTADMFEAVIPHSEELEEAKVDDGSSPEIIEEIKMNRGILLDTSTCSLYFETSTEEVVDESQIESHEENLPTLVIESVSGGAEFPPSSEDDQKDYQTLEPMAVMPMDVVVNENEMAISPDLPDVLLATDVESKDTKRKLDLVDSEDEESDDQEEDGDEEEQEIEEEEDEYEEDTEEDEEENDYSAVKDQAKKSRSEDEESIVVLDSEDENSQPAKPAATKAKMSYTDSEEEDEDMYEEELEDDEDEKEFKGIEESLVEDIKSESEEESVAEKISQDINVSDEKKSEVSMTKTKENDTVKTNIETVGIKDHFGLASTSDEGIGEVKVKGEENQEVYDIRSGSETEPVFDSIPQKRKSECSMTKMKYSGITEKHTVKPEASIKTVTGITEVNISVGIVQTSDEGTESEYEEDYEAKVHIQAINTSDEEMGNTENDNAQASISVELVNSSDEEDATTKVSEKRVNIVEIFEKDYLKSKEKNKSIESVEIKSDESRAAEETSKPDALENVLTKNNSDLSKNEDNVTENIDKVEVVTTLHENSEPVSSVFAEKEMDFETCITFSEISKSSHNQLKEQETNRVAQVMDLDNDDAMDFEAEISASQISKPILPECSHKEISAHSSEFVGKEEAMEVQQSVNETNPESLESKIVNKKNKRSSVTQDTNQGESSRKSNESKVRKSKIRARSASPENLPALSRIHRGGSAPPEDDPSHRWLIEVKSCRHAKVLVLHRRNEENTDSRISEGAKIANAWRSRRSVLSKLETDSWEIIRTTDSLQPQGTATVNVEKRIRMLESKLASVPPEGNTMENTEREEASSPDCPTGSVSHRDLRMEDTGEKPHKSRNIGPVKTTAENVIKRSREFGNKSVSISPENFLAEETEKKPDELGTRAGSVSLEDIPAERKEIKPHKPGRIKDSVSSEDLTVEGRDKIPHNFGSRIISVPPDNTQADKIERKSHKSSRRAGSVPPETCPKSKEERLLDVLGSPVSSEVTLRRKTQHRTKKPSRRGGSVPPDNYYPVTEEKERNDEEKRTLEKSMPGSSSSVQHENIPTDKTEGGTCEACKTTSFEDLPLREEERKSDGHGRREGSIPPEFVSVSETERKSHKPNRTGCFPSEGQVEDVERKSLGPREDAKSKSVVSVECRLEPAINDTGDKSEVSVDGIPERPSSRASTASTVQPDAVTAVSDIGESNERHRDRPSSVCSEASTVHLKHSRKHSGRSRHSSISSEDSSFQGEEIEVDTARVHSSRSHRACPIHCGVKLDVVQEEPEDYNGAGDVNRMGAGLTEGECSRPLRNKRGSESDKGDFNWVLGKDKRKTRSETGSIHNLPIQSPRPRKTHSEVGSDSSFVVRTLRSRRVYSESEDDASSQKSAKFTSRRRIRADSTSGGESISSQQIMEEYATARRLTRHQRSLLERSLELATAPVSQSARLPVLRETSDDEELDTSSVGTRSSSRLSARHAGVGNISPEMSQASTVEASPQKTPRRGRRSLSRSVQSPGSVKSEASTVYASSVTSLYSHPGTSPTSTRSEDVTESRMKLRSFQKSRLPLKSASEKGYPLGGMGSSPGDSDRESVVSFQTRDSHVSPVIRLSGLQEEDFSSPPAFQFSPPTLVCGAGKKEAMLSPVPEFVFSPPQKQQPHPKVHRSNLKSQQTRAHTMALRGLHTIAEESSPSTSSSSLPKPSERDTTPIAVKRSKKFRRTPKSSSQRTSTEKLLNEEEGQESRQHVSRRFLTSDTYSVFRQRKTLRLRRSSKSSRP